MIYNSFFDYATKKLAKKTINVVEVKVVKFGNQKIRLCEKTGCTLLFASFQGNHKNGLGTLTAVFFDMQKRTIAGAPK